MIAQFLVSNISLKNSPNARNMCLSLQIRLLIISLLFDLNFTVRCYKKILPIHQHSNWLHFRKMVSVTKINFQLPLYKQHKIQWKFRLCTGFRNCTKLLTDIDLFHLQAIIPILNYILYLLVLYLLGTIKNLVINCSIKEICYSVSK